MSEVARFHDILPDQVDAKWWTHLGAGDNWWQTQRRCFPYILSKSGNNFSLFAGWYAVRLRDNRLERKGLSSAGGHEQAG